MFFTSRTSKPSRRRSERGATLTGYSLTMAVMVVVALGSMSALETNSEDFLENTGDKIGEPRESAQVAVSNAQQSYGNGNSTGNGASPPATPAPNVSSTTTTTTAAPTTTAAAPTTTTTAAPTTTTVAAVPQATAGFSYNGSQTFYNDPDGAIATGIVSTVSLVAGDAGTYRVEFQLLDSGGGSQDSFFVDYGEGLKRYNTKNNVSSPTWQTQGVSGGAGVTTILINLTQGETLDVSLYPREPGVQVGDVRIVKVS